MNKLLHEYRVTVQYYRSQSPEYIRILITCRTQREAEEKCKHAVSYEPTRVIMTEVKERGWSGNWRKLPRPPMAKRRKQYASGRKLA